MVNASDGGSLNTKTPKQAGELIETMAANKYQMTSERQRGVLHVNATYAFLAQSKLLTQAVTTMTQHMVDIRKQMSQVQLAVTQTPPFGIETLLRIFKPQQSRPIT